MNESIESIVAEMRERADAMQTHGTAHGVRLAVLEFARRIEAAWKREREELERYAASKMLDGATIVDNRGNAAAMREALLNIQEYAAAMDVDDGNVLAILDACRDALSAPAKNCDRYKDAPSAFADFFVPWKQDRHINDVPTLQDFANWLFAHAAERKGENDAI